SRVRNRPSPGNEHFRSDVIEIVHFKRDASVEKDSFQSNVGVVSNFPCDIWIGNRGRCYSGYKRIVVKDVTTAEIERRNELELVISWIGLNSVIPKLSPRTAALQAVDERDAGHKWLFRQHPACREAREETPS